MCADESDIINAHRRDIANAHPVFALIKRREHSEMRARIKQFWIHSGLRARLRPGRRWKIACDRLPRFSQIGRSQNRGTIITHAITSGSDVRHIRIQLRRLDARHPLTARRLRQIVRQLRPLAALIFCHPQPPSSVPPTATRAFRRFGQRKHSAVIFCAASRGSRTCGSLRVRSD
jgi:hypothetical protein